MTAINSPFRYAGGKFYARALILEHIPEHSSYIEPFAGGASIFFAKKRAKYNLLNDLDETLINTFRVIRDNPRELVDALEGEVATKSQHFYYKNTFKPSNDLEKAVRWYYLNRTSYSGIMNMKNCFWGYGEKYSMRPENWGNNIIRASEKLQEVNLTCIDFAEVINQVEDNSFLFIDPPYFNADQDKFYTYSFDKKDHLRLCNVLEEHSKRINFLLTYDNTPKVKDLYCWAKEIHDKEWNYTISRTDYQNNGQDEVKNFRGSRNKGEEIFILNYNSSKQTKPLFETMSKSFAEI